MLIQECNNSGLTKREFCQKCGILEKSFYYWLRKLHGQMAESAGPQLVPLDSVPVAEDMCRTNTGEQTKTACRRGYRWGCGTTLFIADSMIDLNKVRIACGYTDVNATLILDHSDTEKVYH